MRYFRILLAKIDQEKAKNGHFWPFLAIFGLFLAIFGAEGAKSLGNGAAGAMKPFSAPQAPKSSI